MSKEIHTYNSIDIIDINDDETDHISLEFLQFFTSSGLPLSRLNLKVRTFIILLRNLYPVSGKYNRTRMIITRLGQCCIEVRILDKEFPGQLYLISRIKLSITENDMLYSLS